jgi:hypothetical protein
MIEYENRNQEVASHPKDIQRITGKSYRQSIRLLQNIRKELNKLQNEFVSAVEDSANTPV